MPVIWVNIQDDIFKTFDYINNKIFSFLKVVKNEYTESYFFYSQTLVVN